MQFYLNRIDLYGHIVLLAAVRKGNFEMVRFLLEHNADPNQEIFSTSPLITAARVNDFHMALLLLQFGADVNLKVSHCTALHWAVDHKHLDMVQLHSEDNFGNTPLHIAPQHNSVAMIELLLQYGADINRKNKANCTTLLLSVGSLEVVQYLLQSFADPNLADNNYCTPLQRATDNDSLETVQVLLQYGANPNSLASTRSPLHIASEKGHLNIVELLVSFHADINQIYEGETAEEIAIRCGCFAVVNYLRSLRRLQWKPGIF
jgi:ankyrin repeat protein